MKKLLSIIIALVLVLGLFSGCTPAEKPYSNYTEVCNTESYYPIFFSLPTDVFNFSLGKYLNIYATYNGYICKFYDSGELRTTYENTYAFSAPYYFDEYIYAMSTDGYLYKIQNNSGEMSAVSEKMNGYAANCIAVNDSFALLTMHTTSDSGKFKIKLMRVDLATGKATELSLGTDHRIYCSAGGVMYVYTKETVDREEVWSLYEIPTDGEPIYICDMTDIGETPRFVLEEGMFYFADETGALCAKSLITGNTVICRADAGIYPVGDYNESGMVFCQGNIIFYNYNTGCIESVYTPDFGAKGRKFVTIASSEYDSVSHIDMSALSGLAEDLTISYNTFSEEEIILKLMAGDDDIDVYFISASTAKTLLDKNIYTPIVSETVKAFNDNCFDYLADFCLSESGETALMPISNYVYGMVYPIEAQEEAGFERDDLLYYDGFMELAKNHGTDRYVFQYGTVIYSNLHMQYAEYYCDFPNGEFDFTTDLYKNIFTELWTYTDYENNQHSVFTHPNYIDDERYPKQTDVLGKPIPFGTIHYYPETALISTGFYTYYDYISECPSFPDEWRAVPMPRISEKVEANYTNAKFAYVNPYSQRKESAVYALEAIADNYMKVRGGQAKYSFLLENKSAYSSSYYPESQVFGDFYDIARDGFIFTYEIGSAVICDNYSKGLISAEEALNELQRQVEIWLNE